MRPSVAGSPAAAAPSPSVGRSPVALLPLRVAALVGSDLAAVMAAWIGALAWNTSLHFPDPTAALAPATSLLLSPLLFAAHGLYDTIRPPAPVELKRSTQSLTVGFLFVAAATTLSPDRIATPRLVLVEAWLLALALIPMARASAYRLFGRCGWWRTPAIVLGAGRTAQLLLEALERRPDLGIRAAMIVDDDTTRDGSRLNGVPVSTPIEVAIPLAAEHRIRTAIVAMPGAPAERMLQIWRSLGPHFPHVLVIPPTYGFASLWIEAKPIGGLLALELRQSLLTRSARIAKRSCDIALCLICGLPILLLTIAIVIAIVLEDRRWPFFKQLRVGRDGELFPMWKFRTMRSDAPKLLREHLQRDESARLEWLRDQKLREDPRITRVGALLRKLSLDELPQLWNVLVGHMSLVGPRPIVPDERARYGNQYPLYCKVRPGMSGLWQVSGRNNTSYEQRVELDGFYVQNWSIWLDVIIIARTLPAILRTSGAY